MDEQEAIFAAIRQQFAEESPTSRAVGRVADRALQLFRASRKWPASAPALNPSGRTAPLIVISQDANVAPHGQVDALARIRPVADDVAQAIDLANGLLIDIG